MRTTIVVITADRLVSQTIGTKKAALIPADVRKKYPNLTIASRYVRKQEEEVEDILEYFRTLHAQVTGVIVLCDNRLAVVGAKLTTPLFTVWYDHQLERKTINNYFGMVIGKAVRCFGALSQRFDDEKHRKLLVLPLRNFRADELSSLHLLFKNGVKPRGDFATDLDKLLKQLRGRQTPKVEKEAKTTYIVDDEQRYYEYGKERHSKPETKMPPHSLLCHVTAIFRFGKRYDAERHFNVTLEKGEISGMFDDCHDSPIGVASCTHINMFPNDFVA